MGERSIVPSNLDFKSWKMLESSLMRSINRRFNNKIHFHAKKRYEPIRANIHFEIEEPCLEDKMTP
jgi:hypothetical protein